jgi:hypothetical protein
MELVHFKNIVMQQSKTILSLTTNLLAYGGFNHLKDDQVSALHHLILRLKEPLSRVQENLLLTFWSNADAAVLPAALLYRCNTVLQQRGCNPIGELYVEMEMD